MSRRLIVATHNVKKGAEMTAILSARFPDLEILTLADFPGAPEPEETGDTYEENSAIKARSACEHTGEWCVADDAGLEIDALPGQLGVWSKRFAGEETPFPEKIQRILELMQEVPDGERGARFRCLVALARPGMEVELFEGRCEGMISREPRGTGGFGYDPIFWVPEMSRTMAELSPAEKASISHRGKVLDLTARRLAALLGQQN
jgi:XTP/dITP diphosphohydrolase